MLDGCHITGHLSQHKLIQEMPAAIPLTIADRQRWVIWITSGLTTLDHTCDRRFLAVHNYILIIPLCHEWAAHL